MLEFTLWIVSIILVLLGLVGTVLPALPGAPLVFAGLFINAWMYDFTRVGWPSLTILGILTVITFVIDFAATAMGAQRVGASKIAIIGAAIGSVVGIFFGIIGMIFGPFFGALVGELYARKDLYRAGKVGVATWIGILVGTVIKVGLIFMMLAVYLWAVLI